MTYLLVCEGGTDVQVLRSLVEKCGHKVRTLKPSLDATSGYYEAFGWLALIEWCVDNHQKIRGRLVTAGAECLLVHLDTDITDKTEKVGGDGTKLSMSPTASKVVEQLGTNHKMSSMSRRDCCVAALNKALNSSQMPATCYYILPTMATETWLLACYDVRTHPGVFAKHPGNPGNYESYQDPEAMLVAIGLSKTPRCRLKKTPELYQNYAQKLVKNLPKARKRCPELDDLCNFLQ